MSTPSTAYRTCASATSHLPVKFRAPRKQRINRWIFQDLIKQPLETISNPALQGTEGHIVPKDLKCIGSYNWIDAPRPTIIVPGSPPIWVEKPTPLTVPRDSGMDFIDQNVHRMKRKFVLLPLISAVQNSARRKRKSTPKFDWPSVDFVADRNSLRKLVAWANNKSGHWRIDAQLAGIKTVLLSGCPLATKQTSGRSESYGFSFEKACTQPAPGCETGTGHHRIVTYDFGGLKMVVRFEVDACLPLRSSQSHGHPGTDAASLPSTMLAINKPTLRLPHVAVIRAGARVPQSHLIELKTCSGSGKDWSKTYPQLFLSQTPHVYYGNHRGGNFSEIKKFTLGAPHLEPIDRNAQDGFKKLNVLLMTIQGVVGRYGTDGRISLVCQGRELGVYQRLTSGSFLPKYALALFRPS